MRVVGLFVVRLAENSFVRFLCQHKIVFEFYQLNQIKNQRCKHFFLKHDHFFMFGAQCDAVLIYRLSVRAVIFCDEQDFKLIVTAAAGPLASRVIAPHNVSSQ